MSEIKTDIPLPVAPLTGPDGRISEIWWRFLLDIFNRTGGTTGNTGTVDAIYPDVELSLSTTDRANLAESTISSSSTVNESISPFEQLINYQNNVPELQEISFSVHIEDNKLPDERYMQGATEDRLSEMVFPTVYATDAVNFSGLNTDGSNDVLFGVSTTSFRVRARGAGSGTNGGTGFYVDNGATNTIFLGNKSIKAGGAYDGSAYLFSATPLEFSNSIKVPGGTQLIQTTSALNNGAAAATATLTNAPVAGNPTKWIPINDNGTIRYVPSW